MAVALTKPTVGASVGTWGTENNAALDQINGYDCFAYKTATQTVSASTTLVDDTHMTVALPAAGTYVVTAMFLASGTAAGDLKVAWAYTGTLTNGYRGGQGPSSASTDALAATNAGTVRSAAAGNTASTVTSSAPYGVDGTNFSCIQEAGVIIVSTTGTLKVQWAQLAASGSTVLQPGSFLWARRVA
jgi:hypothetical protein